MKLFISLCVASTAFGALMMFIGYRIGLSHHDLKPSFSMTSEKDPTDKWWTCSYR